MSNEKNNENTEYTDAVDHVRNSDWELEVARYEQNAGLTHIGDMARDLNNYPKQKPTAVMMVVMKTGTTMVYGLVYVERYDRWVAIESVHLPYPPSMVELYHALGHRLFNGMMGVHHRGNEHALPGNGYDEGHARAKFIRTQVRAHKVRWPFGVSQYEVSRLLLKTGTPILRMVGTISVPRSGEVISEETRPTTFLEIHGARQENRSSADFTMLNYEGNYAELGFEPGSQSNWDWAADAGVMRTTWDLHWSPDLWNCLNARQIAKTMELYFSAGSF